MMRRQRLTIFCVLVLLGAVGCVQPEPAGPVCGSILYQEPFGGGGPGWGQTTDSSSRSWIEDGRYQIEVLEGWTDVCRWNEEEGPYSDLCYSAKVWALSDGAPADAGLLFRCADEERFYVFSIRPGTGSAGLARRTGGRVTPIHFVSTAPVHGVGEANELRVIARGDSFWFYVNGDLVLEESDASLSSGCVGLYARLSDEGTAAFAFDDLIVRGVK